MSVSTDEDQDTGRTPDDEEMVAETEADSKAVGSETDAEAGETQADDGGSGGDDGATPTARNWRRPALWGALVTVFVALLVAVGVLGWQLWQERQVTQAAEQARQAATEYAQVLTSIDSEKVDENFDAVLDGATGEFKDMYSQSSSQLRQLLIDNKASARGVVLESAVQSASEDKAVVLLFVDQSVSNTNVPDPRLDRSRIKMTMEYVDGRWRASKVELP
ncbi:tetratricopeptide repeat protein [Mycobacterium sp. SMC-4]|uniref:tetratricopeptide repeat protein n=1 Tax=Mycobacterium sp. SMC-4 TaxID=2857059 RepID=UPI003CFDEDB2